MENDLEYMKAHRPERKGFNFTLYQHPITSSYQWINDENVATEFAMVQVYPAPPGAGFGLVSFGRAPFGH